MTSEKKGFVELCCYYFGQVILPFWLLMCYVMLALPTQCNYDSM